MCQLGAQVYGVPVDVAVVLARCIHCWAAGGSVAGWADRIGVGWDF